MSDFGQGSRRLPGPWEQAPWNGGSSWVWRAARKQAGSSEQAMLVSCAPLEADMFSRPRCAIQHCLRSNWRSTTCESGRGPWHPGVVRRRQRQRGRVHWTAWLAERTREDLGRGLHAVSAVRDSRSRR